MYPFLHELCFIQWLWSLDWLLKQAKCDTWLLSFYSSQGKIGDKAFTCLTRLHTCPSGHSKTLQWKMFTIQFIVNTGFFSLVMTVCSASGGPAQKYRSIILSQDVKLILVFYKSTMERSLCTQAFWHRYSRHTHTHMLDHFYRAVSLTGVWLIITG